MRAVILAGGKGVRLRPYTTLIPKPLVPIGGKYAILEIVIMQLAKAGFEHITIAVNHLSNLIMAYFGDGARWNVRIDYSREDAELSTIGPLSLIDDLPEDFLVMNGDILTNMDYRKFYETHVTARHMVSVSVFRRIVNIDFGVLKYSDAGRLVGFDEKPKMPFDVSMGIYCINREVIRALPRGRPYGFDNLMKDSLAEGKPVAVCPFSGLWLDIGRPEDYELANEDWAALAAKLGLTL